MKRLPARVTAMLLATAMLLSASPSRAQSYEVRVYDESNWYEAVLQLIQIYEQFQFVIRQARRLPLDMLARYHGHSVDWTLHDLETGLQYAQRILGALNTGDLTGDVYREIVQPLDLPADVVSRMPIDLQRRLTKTYASIEMADSVSALAVNQLGAMRTDGPHNQQVAKDMEKDAVSTRDDFHSQIAVLNKINTAAVLGLRMQDHMNEALLSSLEQLLVANRRQRDAEAILMNATIHQWRYGQAYGEDLFRNTAAALDGWRQH